MKPEKLANMANQIATFFHSFPAEEGIAGIRRHIVLYWTPSMRTSLENWIEQENPGVDPLVAAAMRRDEQEQPTAPAPQQSTEKEGLQGQA